MKPDKNSPDQSSSKGTQQRNMSRMMIDMADNNKLDGSNGTSQDKMGGRMNPLKAKDPLDKKVTPLAGIVNRPLVECYPEIADDENEQLLADVRRHWLGRFSILFGGGFLLAALIAFAIFAPSMAKEVDIEMTAAARAGLAFVFVLVGALIAIGTFISLWVYNQSRMLITDQNVIELKQMSLFSHKVSHLNMINVEDVTVIKHGIIQTLFNYGLLSIETAGEKENFAFPNTPHPDAYRRMVINAHERAIEHVGQMGPAQRVQITENGL